MFCYPWQINNVDKPKVTVTLWCGGRTTIDSAGHRPIQAMVIFLYRKRPLLQLQWTTQLLLEWHSVSALVNGSGLTS